MAVFNEELFVNYSTKCMNVKYQNLDFGRFPIIGDSMILTHGFPASRKYVRISVSHHFLEIFLKYLKLM